MSLTWGQICQWNEAYLSDAADDVRSLRAKIWDCQQYADVYGLNIGDDGSVSYRHEPDQSVLESAWEWANSFVADGYRLELTMMIGRVLTFAGEIDEDLARRLGTLTSPPMKGRAESVSSHSPGLPNLPQSDWSASEVSQWWSALSEADKQW